MLMPPRVRTLALILHVLVSVGWLGAVVIFLILAVIGMTSSDGPTVRGVYLVMEPAAWYGLVPLAGLSLLTGLISSLGTHWGLFRHYWVVIKLSITTLATIILLLYMQTFAAMRAIAATQTLPLEQVRQPSPVLHAAAALLALLITTVLAIAKPRGLTPYGWRVQRAQRLAAQRGRPDSAS